MKRVGPGVSSVYIGSMVTQAQASSQLRYCLFETAIGDCGIAWSERGVTRLHLPESDRAATERRLKARAAGAESGDPPAPIRQVIADIQRYAQGERVDFSAIAVDMPDIEPLRRSVYDAARAIGWGETASYGDIARSVGTSDAREVGQALSRNPVPIVVPCHRVLASDGKLHGFSAYGGILTKERLLSLEGFGADAPRLPGL
jgi:methylated-DNA-[protein]-cysteine S-methyltransferase